jgi:hypothetical protein
MDAKREMQKVASGLFKFFFKVQEQARRNFLVQCQFILNGKQVITIFPVQLYIGI